MTLTYTDGEPVQVGDRVTLEGEVIGFTGDYVRVKAPFETWLINPRDITSHSSPPIKAGDKATWNSGSVVVLAIDGKHAWIRAGDARFTADVADLRRVTP